MEDSGRQKENDEEEKRGGFSFSFAKKKKETKSIEVKKFGEADISERKTETDYILSLDSNKVTSVVPKEKPKELVIPLIQRNDWQTKKRSEHDDSEKKKRPADTSEKDDERRSKKKKEEERKPGSVANSLESEAVKEIMEDVSRYNENWGDRGNEDLGMTIPLLMQNKVPEGYETDDKLDVSIRPDAATETNYEEVPIEQFGMAMLRGMGWKEDEGIGNKLKKVVEPIEVTVRPKGQGLGADRRPGDALNEKKKRRRKPGDPAVKEEEEPKGFAKGAHVLVCSGPHKNLYGIIEGVDEDNSRVVIKFALSSQAATLSQFAVQLITKEDYKKYSKDLGKFSRGHDEIKKKGERESQDDSESDGKKHKHRDDKERTSSSSRHDKHSRDKRKEDDERPEKYSKRDRYEEREQNQNGERHGDRHSHSRDDRQRDEKDYERSRSKDDRHRHRNDDGRDSSRRKEEGEDRSTKQASDRDRQSSSNSEKTVYWLRSDLRVRLIDATFKKGKYYNVKVKVVDVITRDTCTCQTDDGRFLEDIHQSMVETLIPKSDPAYIMVVTGKLKGQIGTVIKRDKVKCQADVQLLREREKIIKMDYDIICEYAGNIHDEEDY